MILKKITVVLLLFLLTACGYHLRGAIELPQEMAAIYLESASSELQQQMKKALKSSQGKLVSSAADAGLIIKLSREEMSSQVVSLNSAGRANQFQLIYALNYTLYDPSGKALSKEQSMTIKREYFNDQTDILGKTNEEKVIRTEMYQQAVSSIANQIAAAAKAKP